jgi:hypothetical protein
MTSTRNNPTEPQWMSWAEWKAQMLNRLFQRQGVLKQRARITAETVRRGLLAESIKQKDQKVPA